MLSSKIEPKYEDISQALDSFCEKFDERNVIFEGVKKRLENLGGQYDDSDVGSILKELNERYKSMGIENGVPRTVKNWVSKGKTPNDAPAYRENLYELCMALQMSLEDTEEFFVKHYMTIPFIYKNRVDASYYYGLKNGKTYLEIKRILNMADDNSEVRDETDESTDRVIMDIDTIKDDDLFIEYLRNHTFSKEKQFQTVRTKIDDLEKKIIDIVERFEKKEKKSEYRDDYSKGYHSIRNADGTINHKKLVFYLTGQNFQALDENGKRENVIAKSEKLPKMFRENFPIDQVFTMIHKGTASADQYRKALILLKFYEYFETKKSDSGLTLNEYLERSQEKCNEDIDDFEIETNKRLVICGMSPLYIRNPFDCLILYCAHCSDPIYYFSIMIEIALPEKE